MIKNDQFLFYRMGLPPALAARLAKRGIKVENRKKDEEEIFAEDKITAILDEFGKKLPKNWDKVNFFTVCYHQKYASSILYIGIFYTYFCVFFRRNV